MTETVVINVEPVYLPGDGYSLASFLLITRLLDVLAEKNVLSHGQIAEMISEILENGVDGPARKHAAPMLRGLLETHEVRALNADT